LETPTLRILGSVQALMTGTREWIRR